MKTFLSAIFFVFMAFQLFSQDSELEQTGLPGDNFSLEGALELFKKSVSPEEFEKALNTADNHVNNLDLNEDGETDYITVLGRRDKDVHIFVLQIPVSESEKQDIAVIEIEKTGDENAILQIVGDEDIYGEEIIIEPSDGNDEPTEEVKRGPASVNYATLVVNVWAWPSVRFVYAPGYTPWVSPWRWRNYPIWWKPWRPLGWAVWHPFRVRHYHPTIRVTHTHRVVHAHRIYKPVRVSSTTVRVKHEGARANYKVNKSKTKVTGPRGNSVTKKSTTVRDPKGNVRGQKTTVKRSRKN